MVHTTVAGKVRWGAEWALLVLLVWLVHAFGEWRHHWRHVILAVWVSLDSESVLFIPAPLIDLSDTKSSLLGNSFALGITPSRVHLELLLQDQLLVTILLGSALRLVLLALVMRNFLFLVFAFFSFLFLLKLIAFNFFIFNRNCSFLQFIHFLSQFFISSFRGIVEWLLNTHVILILRVRKKIVEVRLERHLVHAFAGDLSKWCPHWSLQMR